MAKEDFKNKVTKAQEDLFKSLDNERTKRHTVVTKIIGEISKQKKANVKTLNTLNKDYLTLCQNDITELQVFIDKINSLNTELENGINTFKENYKIEDEKQKLIEEKDKVLLPLKQKAKREGHDINTKMERIDKELVDTLDDRNNEFEENEKAFKAKVLEYDKRRRIELQRIQNNIVKECDEFQKRLIVENKRSEINKLKKNIKEIRYQGLLSEKDCLLKYSDEIEQVELNHVNEVYNYNIENITLTKDYKTRYTTVKLDKLLNEQRYENEFSLYEIEVNNTLAVNNKEMLEKQNGIKGVYYDKISRATLSELDKERKINKAEQDNINNIILTIDKLDNAQVKKFIDANNADIKSLENEIKLFQKNLVFTMNFYLQNIINSYQSYFKELYTKESNFLNNLLVNDADKDFLNGFSYSEYTKLLTNCFEEFKVLEEQSALKFEERIKEVMNILINQVEEFVNNILKINSDIVNEVNEYHEKMIGSFSDAKTKALSFIETMISKKNEDTIVRENNNNSLLVLRKEALEEELVEIKKDYDACVKDVNDLKEVENKKYQEICENINKQIQNEQLTINETYDIDYRRFTEEKQEKESAIKEKFIVERNKIEKTYKTKIGLL